jgi:alginate O-acetyltransferase complex protein AlgI
MRRDVNLVATMGLGGLWHGASANFIVWGLWHGMLLLAHRRLRLSIRLARPIAISLTFLLVTIGWVFFRMRDFDGIGNVLAAMAGLHGGGEALGGILPYLVVAGVLMWCVPEEWTWSLPKWGPGRLALLATITGVAILYMNTTQKFIYFQF